MVRIRGVLSACWIDEAMTPSVVGEQLEAKCMGIDKKAHVVALSVKAIEMDEEQAIKDFSRKNEESMSSTTLGDILKEQMDDSDADDK